MYSLLLHGRKLGELQKWRSLRFALNLAQNEFAFSNSFSSTSASDASLQAGRKGTNFTASYLVRTLGLTTKLAESISRKVSFENRDNADSVLSLFRSYGFTVPQICDIITDYPQLLISDAEGSLAPKLLVLRSLGDSSSELTEIVTTVPRILGKERFLRGYYDSVKEVMEADKSYKFEKLNQSSPLSSLENKVRNVSVLREMGMPQHLLLTLLICKSQPICGKENFDASLKKVVEMGFDPTTTKFILALRMLYQMSDKTIDEKVEVYKSLGFTEEDIWENFKRTPSFLKVSKNKILSSMETFLGLGFSKDEFLMMVRLYPTCIEYSAESVKKKTGYLLKKMNWPVKAVALHPQVVGYSLERRIIPRCKVIKALLSKRLLGKGSKLPPVSSVFSCTDLKFLNKYVMKDDKLVPEFMGVITGKRDQKALLQQ